MNFWKSCAGMVLAGMVCSSHATVEFREADITTVKNIVERTDASGSAPAQVNDKITEKTKVSTAAASMAELTFADSSITRMGANTQFSFQSKERLVKLEQGTVLIHTPPGNGGATVDCGGVTASVSGTTFMASHDNVGNVMFVLLEGQGGLKVSVGGSSTVIRAGQAASIGADVKKQAVGTAPGAKTTTADGNPAKTENQGGSDGGPAPAKNSASASPPGGGDAGGTQVPAAPKIQVFEVDVKKLVSTTPLIVEFKKELPSVSKIEKVAEVQETSVKAGKIEKTETEIVLIKHDDGDVLVGAPQVKREETVVINRKEDGFGVGQGGQEKLDVETAAGPGVGNGNAGGGGGSVANNPPASLPAAPPPNPPSPVNPGQLVTQQPTPPTAIAVTARVRDATRPFNEANPAFGFSITSGSLLPGHSLVTGFLTPATSGSGVAGSPYTISFSNPRIVDGSGADVTSRYNLTTVPGVLNVTKASPNLSFSPLGSLVFGQSVNLVASSLTGSPTFELVNTTDSSKVSISGGQLSAISGTGTVQVRAVMVGNDNYNNESSVQTITLAKAEQSVSFTLPTTLTYLNGTPLSATKLDSGTVSFSVVSGPGTFDMNGRLVATSGTGSVVVRATAAGDANYNGAFTEQTVTLTKAGQNLAFDPNPTLLTGAMGFIPVSGSQTGATVYSILETDGRASVGSGGIINVGKILGADSFTLRAVAAGNDNYNAAQQDVTVGISPDNVGLLQANVARRLLHGPTEAAELDALQKFFYYTGKLASYGGDAPQVFWQDVRSFTYDLGQLRTAAQPVRLYNSQTSTYFMMGDLVTGSGAQYRTDMQNKDTVVFANSVRVGIHAPGAQTVQNSSQTAIPDGNATGLTSSVNLASLGASSSFAWFVDRVGLNVSGNPSAYGAFNGDFVSELRYTDAAGASRSFNLMNRIGASATDPDGAESNGFRISLHDFADAAVHDAVPVGSSTAELAGSYRPGFGQDLLGLGLGPVKSDGTMELVMADLSSGAQGILDSWSVSLVQRLAISLDSTAGKNFTLVAGDGGMQLTGTLWDLGGASAEFMTTGDLKFFANDFYHPGAAWRAEGAGSVELASVRVLGDAATTVTADIGAKGNVSLVDTTVKGISGDLNIQSQAGSVELLGSKEITTDMTAGPVAVSGNVDLEAQGKVKITGATSVDIDTSVGVAPDTGTSPAVSSSIAVIRSGDSLELRNVAITGFGGAKLEKVNPTTRALEGRVLISGSAVRDFKIKELVGAAINADAKIQMAALDSQGRLAGDLTVEGQMPVATQLAGALASLGAGDAPASTPVHADRVDLAAKHISFNNASISAMNSITARANTILVQNSFMTVVRNSGMINMYVSSGLVNQGFGTMVNGQVNFAGLNQFTIGNTSFAIGNQTQLDNAYANKWLLDINNRNNNVPEPGKVNVLRL